MKKLAIVVVVILVIGAALLLRPREQEDPVQQQLALIGSRLLGVPFAIDKFSFDPETGIGELRGLRVANPEGYEGEDAIDIADVRLAVDLQSLSTDTLVLQKVDVNAPAITLANRGDGSNNLQKLQNNADWNATAADRAAAAEQALPQRIVIRQLTISGMTYSIEGPAPVTGEPSGTLPPGGTSNLGGASGSSPAETGKALLAVLVNPVLEQVLQDQPERAREQDARDALKGLGDLFGQPAE